VRNEEHKVFFIDNYLKPSNFIKEGYLQKNNIDFVGIHTNTICYQDTLRMFNEIENLRKKRLWNGKIIAGGPHTSVALETIPDFVDYVVQGEGERAILEIINGKTNERVIRKKRIQNLDSIPFQPWDIFNKLPYDYSCPWMDIKPVFTMNTSRGCPFNCIFCSVGSIWGKQYTYFSTDRIISEIEYLIKNYRAKGIYFREDNFTLNYNRTIEFCERLLKKSVNLQWACETRVDTICNENLIKLMSKSGCKAVYLGIESGSQKVLDALHKGITVEQIEKTTKLCRKYNIRTYWSLLIGTPYDTYRDYLKTLKLIKKIKPFSYNFNVYVGIPNSLLYKYILENKLYEYKDDIKLLYLPGFDIKTNFFYNLSVEKLVDYNFNTQTEFDKLLEKHIRRRKIKVVIKKIIKIVLPYFLKIRLKKWLKILK